MPAQLNGLAGLEIPKSVSSNYPDANSPHNTHLLGLLEITNLQQGMPASLHTESNSHSPTLMQVSSYDQLITREVAYEQPAAVVYAQVQGWYRVRLRDSRYGWVAPAQAGGYFDYAQLPVNRLAYPTHNWSGFVWPGPGAGLPVRYSAAQNPDSNEFPAEIVESTEIGGSTWFRVEVLAKDPCSNAKPARGISGWVPAYGVNGEPTAWFYSRGC